MSDTMWVTSYFAPGLGVLLANMMWATQAYVMLQARRLNDMHSLNPIPFAVTFLNCIGWTMYGVLRSDYFIYFANVTGLTISLACSISAISLLSQSIGREGEDKITGKEKSFKNKERVESRDLLEQIVSMTVIFWSIILLLVRFVWAGTGPSVILVGAISCVVTIIFYAAPMSTLLQVLHTRDASSLYPPMVAANLANGLTWFVYGLVATQDPLLWVPNGVGALLACIQLGVIAVFRSWSCGCCSRDRNGSGNNVTGRGYDFDQSVDGPSANMVDNAHTYSEFRETQQDRSSKDDNGLEVGLQGGGSTPSTARDVFTPQTTR